MKTGENTDISIRQDENQATLQIKTVETAKAHGIPQTDAELTRAFILKSHSQETRRTYRTTLQTFAAFCEKRHGRKLTFAEVTFTHVTEWRDWLITEGRRPHTISTKLAILRSLFEYGRALGIFNLNPASAKLVPPPKKPKHSPGRALAPMEVKSLLSWFVPIESFGFWLIKSKHQSLLSRVIIGWLRPFHKPFAPTNNASIVLSMNI